MTTLAPAQLHAAGLTGWALRTGESLVLVLVAVGLVVYYLAVRELVRRWFR